MIYQVKPINITDKDVMNHRFANLGKSTGELAKYLGVSRRDYEDACKRAMEAEAKELNREV